MARCSVPPTSQILARLEQDLRQSPEACGLDLTDAELQLYGETVIRNNESCISCVTQFPDQRMERA